jgi:hypothetical protein
MKGRASESRINDSDALFVVVTSMYNDGTCFSIDTQGMERNGAEAFLYNKPCTLGATTSISKYDIVVFILSKNICRFAFILLVTAPCRLFSFQVSL